VKLEWKARKVISGWKDGIGGEGNGGDGKIENVKGERERRGEKRRQEWAVV